MRQLVPHPVMDRCTLSACLALLAVSTCAGAQVFNILDFGAEPDGSKSSTDAFRSALQAANAAGGGTVFVPAGNYISGPIELVNNLVLHLDAGATIRFPATRLPFTQGREQGIECLTPVPLIGGRHLVNVTITGRGVLTTDNASWLQIMPRTKASKSDPGSAFGPNWELLLEQLELKTPQPEDAYLKAAPELRPSFIRTMDSTNILIEGIHIVGSPMWSIHLLYTEKAVVRDVTIETYPGVHTDGIAVDSSRNVRISGCFIDTGDDGIVLKAGKDADGRRVNRPTENVTISDCNVRHAHGAVTLGSETAGGIRNVVAENITCDGTQIGVRIKSRRGRGGSVRDVRFSHWTMENVGQGINVTSYYLMEGELRTSAQPVSEKTPVFEDIAMNHMTIRGARVAINIEGLPEMPISGLHISDVVAYAKTGAKARYTTGLELHDVQVNPESGPAFQIRDSQQMVLDGVGTDIALTNAPVVRLDRCPGTVVRSCQAPPHAASFLSVAPGERSYVTLQNNVLSSARKPIEEIAEPEAAAEPATEE